MILAVAILAAEAGSDVTSLAQYGILGVVCIAIIAGPLVPWRFYVRERDRADKLEAAFTTEILPASTAMVQATRDILDYLRSTRR